MRGARRSSCNAASLRRGAPALVAMLLLAGCASPFDYSKVAPSPGPDTTALNRRYPSTLSEERERAPAQQTEHPAGLGTDAAPNDFVQYALLHSPEVEAAYQRWRASAERIAQGGVLPDPRLKFGYFLEEVETRVGPQNAIFGVSQTFPWPGTLSDREGAAERAAAVQWRQFQAAALTVTERVVSTLHELAYLDAAIVIARENLDLLRTFEEVVRARYRVGTGSHPELVRVQVELGQLEDRLSRLTAMRPAYVAELNAAMNRDSRTEVPTIEALPGQVATVGVDELSRMAREANPTLLARAEEIEEQRVRERLARKAGLPDLTVGLDYIVTGEALDSSIPESGDDPILLGFSINVPLWRGKYDAGVREAIAGRLAVSSQRAADENRIAAAIERAWFEHTDADRRVRLFETTLIPKAKESLRSSLAGFRAGDTSFLDLLDTERTLLEFAVLAERARADRGQALARLTALVGGEIPTRAEPGRTTENETPGGAQP